ncbi:MAG: HNH endonuclease signature motif containing protein [Candidatus Paceibacterota bacterium]|jgi:hypothetical protein
MAKVGRPTDISLNRCPLCNGCGAINYDLEIALKEKLKLYDDKKIPQSAITKSIYEVLFLKYGFTPTIGEALEFFEIPNISIYKFFLSKIQKIGMAFINEKVNQRLSRRKRMLAIISTDDGSITRETLDSLIKSQNFKCNLCKCSIVERGNRHADHITPLSKGGEHQINNIQWLCINCNVHKSNKINFNFNEK